MINAVLELVYSFPFAAGLVAGVVGQRVYCHLVALYADRVHPLPNGKHRRVGAISRQWVGGLIAVLCVGYVLFQSQQTHDQTVALSQATRACQADLIRSIERGRSISAENDKLSVEQRDLLALLDEAGGIWINRLINPPEAIAKLEPDDPRRQAWGIDVTRVYYERATKLRERVNQIRVEQFRLAEERLRNELPPPNCERPDNP